MREQGGHREEGKWGKDEKKGKGREVEGGQVKESEIAEQFRAAGRKAVFGEENTQPFCRAWGVGRGMGSHR